MAGVKDGKGFRGSDGVWRPGVIGVDTDGNYAPGGGGGGGGGGATTIADGADIAQGSTTDTASTATIMGRLTALLGKTTTGTRILAQDGDQPNIGSSTSASGDISVIGQLRAVLAKLGTKLGVTSADGDLATLGTTTDPATANTGIGLLKAVKAALASVRTTSQDGDNATMGATGDAATANTMIGLLKAIKAAGGGGGGGGGAVTAADGALVTIGTTTDAATATTLIGLTKAVLAKLLGTLATSTADGGNAAIGATTDAATATTLIGLTKALLALQSPLKYWNDFTNIGLTANQAVNNQTWRDMGVDPGGTLAPFRKFIVFAKSDQAGTLRIQGSPDNGTAVFECASVAVSSAVGAYVEVPTMFRYHRVAYTNGATASSATTCKSAYAAN